MAPGARSKFGAPMFVPEIFRKQMYCIEESICDIVGTLWRPPQWFGAPIVIRHPGNCAPLAPLVTTLRSRGNFRYGVERAKRFVNVHWHCILSNMERIMKISSLPPPGKVSADVRASELKFFKFLEFFRHVLVVSHLQIQQRKNIWIIEILINHFFAIFKVSRPETFETEAENRKNGSRDRDQVSRLHHRLMSSPGKLYWWMDLTRRKGAHTEFEFVRPVLNTGIRPKSSALYQECVKETGDALRRVKGNRSTNFGRLQCTRWNDAYGKVWLVNMSMLTLMTTVGSCCNFAVTTHYASWTLSTQIFGQVLIVQWFVGPPVTH